MEKTNNQPTNLQRLRRLEYRMEQMQKLLDLQTPLVEWALKEIVAEQQNKLELDKRLGIRCE